MAAGPVVHTVLMSDSAGIDPRDPRGLRADAPLLDGWLNFTASA
jgi:hypothetical protein